MKILAVVPSLYDKNPGQRFRIEQWQRYLDPQTYQITYLPFESRELEVVLYRKGHFLRKAFLMTKAFLKRFGEIKKMGGYHLIYLYREASALGPPILEQIIAKQNIPIVYDFDDAIWIPYEGVINKKFSYLKFSAKTGKICRFSRCVITGNHYLENYAKQFNPNVRVIPTAIDLKRFNRRGSSPSVKEKITVGWTGSFSTYPYLKNIIPLLNKVNKNSPIRLKVIGAEKEKLPAGFEVDFYPWKSRTESLDLDDIDIGIMPLPDTPYTRGKCGLKILQYMAKGIPAVAAKVGVNAEIIKDGENGFLAETEEEWIEKINLLMRDSHLREKMGAMGRRTVEEKYSAEKWAAEVGLLFNKVLEESCAE